MFKPNRAEDSRSPFCYTSFVVGGTYNDWPLSFDSANMSTLASCGKLVSVV